MMPIEFRIDHDRRMVFAKATGVMTDEDVFGYQHDVWSRPDVAGYNELIDMSDVDDIAIPSSARAQSLAILSAGMDASVSHTKFAIVAAEDLAFGLGRMYQTYREMYGGAKKKVGVFRSMKEAMEWLGIQNGI